MRTEPTEALALFRFHVVADATNPQLTPGERGALVRQLASQSHTHPDGSARVYAPGHAGPLGARLPGAGS